MRVVVTGAAGFIGRSLIEALRCRHEVVAAVREPAPLPAQTYVIGDINHTTVWASALTGADCVVHLAARVHRPREADQDLIRLYRLTNTLGTLRLAQAAAAAGVRRIIFLSTAKVLGEVSPKGGFHDGSVPAPQDPYAISKWEAEQGLQELCCNSGIELCILRPPLVYGPGVRANFLRLLQWIDSGRPLPFGGVRNLRSFVSVHNLADAVVACLTHQNAAGGTFLVCDGEPVSTPELVRRIAVHLGKHARLLNVPDTLLKIAGSLTGRGAELQRLLGDFVVNDAGLRHALAWNPPQSMDDALRETVAWYSGWKSTE